MACPKFVKEVETPACEETDSGTTWKGKEKQRKTSAFDLLPREIIQQYVDYKMWQGDFEGAAN
jgi:hypothetical protein